MEKNEGTLQYSVYVDGGTVSIVSSVNTLNFLS